MLKITRRLSRLQTLGLVVATLVGLTAVPALAATAPAVKTDKASGIITQSFNADPAVQTGMLVALNLKDASTVVPLKNSQIKTFLGIVIPADNAPIVLTPEQIARQQVLVATSGRYSVLVSNQNGPVKIGDFLTVSGLNGIAMKASNKQPDAIGKAAGNFNGTSDVVGSASLKDTGGQTIKVDIGRVAANIDIETNPAFEKTVNYVPSFVAKVAFSVANKQVSPGRIYLSVAIMLAISIITGNMLYSAVRNGMNAIGRNPLSRKSIMRSLLQTMAVGSIIFIAGIFAVYLLLKL